jgi:hypothetical protein
VFSVCGDEVINIDRFSKAEKRNAKETNAFSVLGIRISGYTVHFFFDREASGCFHSTRAQRNQEWSSAISRSLASLSQA